VNPFGSPLERLMARLRPPRPRPGGVPDLLDDELLARIRRQLDAEALQLYQDVEHRNLWSTPATRWTDREEALVALVLELRQFGVRRARYLRTETRVLCDHLPQEPHREGWQGCRMPVECFVFEVFLR
jgi:hypothetical protein